MWAGSASTILAGWSMRVASQYTGPNASAFPVLILKIARHLLVGLRIRVLKTMEDDSRSSSEHGIDKLTIKKERQAGRALFSLDSMHLRLHWLVLLLLGKKLLPSVILSWECALRPAHRLPLGCFKRRSS